MFSAIIDHYANVEMDQAAWRPGAAPGASASFEGGAERGGTAGDSWHGPEQDLDAALPVEAGGTRGRTEVWPEEPVPPVAATRRPDGPIRSFAAICGRDSRIGSGRRRPSHRPRAP